MVRLILIFKTFLVFCTFPLILSVLLLCSLWRLFTSKILIRFVTNSSKILTCRSSPAGIDGIYTSPKCSLVVVSIFEGTEPLAEIQSAVLDRLVKAVDQNGHTLRPEFQQRVSARFGFLFWETIPHFNIEEYVRLYEGQVTKGQVEVTPEMLTLVGNELTYQPFRAGSSPWEVLILPNYRESSEAPLSTATILHIHHCLGDGFSLLNFSLDFLGANRRNEVQVTLNATPKEQNVASYRNLFNLIRWPFDLISEISDSCDHNSWHVEESQLRRSHNTGQSPLIPISRIKTLKNLHNVTFTTLILACFATSLRKFMVQAGFSVPRSIHCAMPLPMPGHPSGKMRNYLQETGCYVELPIALEASRDRLEAIELELERIKRSTFPVAFFYLLPILGCLVTPILRKVVKNTRTTALVSNFPGPAERLEFNGHKVTSVFFGSGLHNGRCGIGFSALSYGGQIRFVFAVDEGLVTSSDLSASHLVQFFMESLNHLEIEAV